MARVTYSEEAIETARKLYCKYGGKSHELIERDMRKAGWPGWKKSILYDKGKDANARMGWVTKYGFERSLEIHTEKLTESVNNNDEGLYLGIKRTRESLEKKVHSGKASKDDYYVYRDFCGLEINAKKNLDLSKDNFETFVACYEKLLLWLSAIAPVVAKGLIENGEKLTQLAESHYGKQQPTTSEAETPDQPNGGEKEIDSGAGDRKNAGGKRQGNVVAFER